MTIDYKNMKAGDSVKMPVPNVWEGANRALFYEIQDWCATQESRPQFQVETLRAPGKEAEFWLQRIR